MWIGPLSRREPIAALHRLGFDGPRAGGSHEYMKPGAARVAIPNLHAGVISHDLRHTCATILLSQNANPKFVQELLGHSQITVTTERYSHVLPAMHQEAARTMERVFGAGWWARGAT